MKGVPIISQSHPFDYKHVIERAKFIYFKKCLGNHDEVNVPHIVLDEYDNGQLSFVEIAISTDGIKIKSAGIAWKDKIDQESINCNIQSSLIKWLQEMNYEIFIKTTS